MRRFLVCTLVLVAGGCCLPAGEDEEAAAVAADEATAPAKEKETAPESEVAPGVDEDGEAQKLSLSWDAKEADGKVDLSVVAKGQNGYTQRVELGTFPFNEEAEGVCDKRCKDKYTTCKKLRPYTIDTDGKPDKRIKGTLCASLGRVCGHSCEMDRMLHVDMEDGVLKVQAYEAPWYLGKKLLCGEAPKVVKEVRIAPKGSTLSKGKQIDWSKVNCKRKYCGKCNNSGYTRCMNKQGKPGFHDCFCG